ncbi:MAG: hypothetical protein M3Y84_09615, partial [Acidobacteriota bacterium]|nr:hypothetical protein [Acidobacteriota bacterium]
MPLGDDDVDGDGDAMIGDGPLVGAGAVMLLSKALITAATVPVNASICERTCSGGTLFNPAGIWNND